jgi:NADPH2:quinone reductase
MWQFTKTLTSLGVCVKIDPMPVEVANPIRCEIDTVHRSYDSDAVTRHEVVLNTQGLVAGVKALAPDGVDHIVEVAFGANIDAEVEMLKMGGSIGAYATDTATPKIPFWLMVFKNIRVFFFGER